MMTLMDCSHLFSTKEAPLLQTSIKHGYNHSRQNCNIHLATTPVPNWHSTLGAWKIFLRMEEILIIWQQIVRLALKQGWV